MSNYALPGLVSVRVASPDIVVTLGCMPSPAEVGGRAEELAYTSVINTPSGEPALKLYRTQAGTNHLIYSDGTEFWLDPLAGRIWARWPDSLSLHDVTLYLLGPVFGLFLRLRGVVCLHASAIALHERAVLFLGDPGAGKSTTAAAMSMRGHSLIADDIVGILERDGKIFAVPAYPYVSLWPQSAEMICGPDTKLPTLLPGFEKCRFAPSAFQHSPVPLGAVFVLGERSTGENLPGIEELPPRDQLLALIANSYATRALSEKSRAEEFQLFGRMVGAVPIRQLFAHSDPARLSSFCEFIEQACDSLAAPAFA
ncbi:MAG: HPr kinase/phosphorylase [Candidatus Acidiferrales bacterium]